MEVILALVCAYDATDWAHEYGLPPADAADDFAAVLRRAVHDGGIRHTLDTTWPMMRGHTTVYTLDGLDPTTRDQVLRQLEMARVADQNTTLIAEIRDHLAARPHDLYGREPRWVVFHTSERDNGYLLTDTGATVYFDEGDHVALDLDGTCVGDLLATMYGARGATNALGVDLRTGTLAFDDDGDNVPQRLGIPTNDHYDGDGCANYPPDYTVVRNGVEVSITDLRDGDVFIDYDNVPWLADRVSRDGDDVHVDIKPPDAS